MPFPFFPSRRRRGGTPDIAALLRTYSKAALPGAFVLGLDTAAQPVWKPGDAEPALYWRLQGTAPCSYIEDTWSCSFLTATMQLHVFSETLGEDLCRRICDGLLTSRRLLFPDGDGQLLIDEARITPQSDAQRQGQAALAVSFGILRPEEPKTELRHIHYDEP